METETAIKLSIGYVKQASYLSGVSFKIVRDAAALLEVIKEERRVEQLLKDAIAKREINGLLGAISTAEEMKMSSEALTSARLEEFKKKRRLLQN